MAKNIWKEAIIEELIVTHIYRKEHEKDPKKALQDIVAWHLEVANYFERQGRWYVQLWNWIELQWYRSPLPFWLWKITKNQPPF